MNELRPSLVSRTNPDLIREFGAIDDVFEIPFLGRKPCAARRLPQNARKLKKTLACILGDVTFPTLLEKVKADSGAKKPKNSLAPGR
jgi:hypothetical protein